MDELPSVFGLPRTCLTYFRYLAANLYTFLSAYPWSQPQSQQKPLKRKPPQEEISEIPPLEDLNVSHYKYLSEVHSLTFPLILIWMIHMLYSACFSFTKEIFQKISHSTNIYAELQRAIDTKRSRMKSQQSHTCLWVDTSAAEINVVFCYSYLHECTWFPENEQLLMEWCESEIYLYTSIPHYSCLVRAA